VQTREGAHALLWCCGVVQGSETILAVVEVFVLVREFVLQLKAVAERSSSSAAGSGSGVSADAMAQAFEPIVNAAFKPFLRFMVCTRSCSLSLPFLL
jgi:hypothetical protein